MKPQVKKRIGLGEFFVFRFIFILFFSLILVLGFSVFTNHLIFLHVASVTMGVLIEKFLTKIRKNVNTRGIIFFTISTIVMLVYWANFLLGLD